MGILNLDQIKRSIVTSNEVIQILDITRARLCQLVRNGKLKPIKRNIFLLDDIMERKLCQEELRIKFYRPRNKL